MCTAPVTPPEILQAKRLLAGLRSAQAIEPTAARAFEMGQLQFDIDQHEAQRKRYTQ